MSFETVREFEDRIAEFYGAPYAIATDCCTHALELCLRYELPDEIVVPKRTYLSVPMLAGKLGLGLKWKDEYWADYYYITKKIIDAAVLWKPDSYVPGTFMCLSFQFQKHLSLGRGGMILTDDKWAAHSLKRKSYDGRDPEKPWREQNIMSFGYHYYMTPEIAQLGLDKLDKAIATPPRKWTIDDWPDLTQMPVFRRVGKTV